MQLIYLVAAGFSKEEVHDMTLRQVLHIAKVSVRLRRLERLSEIADMQVATPGVDERAYMKHTNSLRYE